MIPRLENWDPLARRAVPPRPLTLSAGGPGAGPELWFHTIGVLVKRGPLPRSPLPGWPEKAVTI